MDIKSKEEILSKHFGGFWNSFKDVITEQSSQNILDAMEEYASQFKSGERREMGEGVIKKLKIGNAALLRQNEKLLDELSNATKYPPAKEPDILASCYQVAMRKGESTNWEALEKRLKEILDAYKISGVTPLTFRSSESQRQDNLSIQNKLKP